MAIFRKLASLAWRPFCGPSGLDRLAEQYPAPDPPPEPVWPRQTIQLNSVRWRKAAKVGLSDQGIYLQVGAMPAALIPWASLEDHGPARLYNLKGRRILLGGPSPVALIVYEKLYQRMAPWLR